MKTLETIKYEYKGKTFLLSIKRVKMNSFSTYFLYVGNKKTVTFADTLNLIVNEKKYQIKYSSRSNKFVVSLTTEYILAGNVDNQHTYVDYGTELQENLKNIPFALDCFLKWKEKNPAYLVNASKKLAS